MLTIKQIGKIGKRKNLIIYLTRRRVKE